MYGWIYIWAARPPLSDHGRPFLPSAHTERSSPQLSFTVPLQLLPIPPPTTQHSNRARPDRANSSHPPIHPFIHSPAALPSILARRHPSRLLLAALRFPPYVLSSSLPITSPAPACCVSTRHCPERRVTLSRPVYYQSSTTSLHRGLLNSLDAASPLSQWTRKQR